MLSRSSWILTLGLAATTPAFAQGFAVEDSAPAKKLSLQFDDPVRVHAGGEPIRLESPGYAAPCLFDVDGDGIQDLVVGQFRGGKIRIHRGLAAENGDHGLNFAEGKWLEVDGNVAEVPGVW